MEVFNAIRLGSLSLAFLVFLYVVREFFQEFPGGDFVFGHLFPYELLAHVDKILLSLHYLDLGYFELMLVIFYFLDLSGLDIRADAGTDVGA